MVSEINRVHAKIPEHFMILMEPHVKKVDEVISPGLTLLRWTSLNLGSFVESVHAALREHDLLIDRVNSIHENRIQVALGNMLNVPLCELPATETITVEEFLSRTSSLCSEASIALDTRSQTAEKAVEELIDLLLGPDQPLEKPDDDTAPGAIATLRRVEQRTKLRQEADILQNTYEQRNIETLIQLTRNTLETIRKRVTTHTYSKRKNENPLFRSDIILALPSLIMRPTLDEIQQGLNKAVLQITDVSKKVYRWGQERLKKEPSSPQTESRPGFISRSDMKSRSRLHLGQAPCALRHYHRIVSDNKDVAKLVSLLSSAISSTKTQVTKGVEHFAKYQELWAVDKDLHLVEFMEGSPEPGVNEFRSEMWQYAQLEELILAEPDTITVGTISLSSDGLKIALCAEAKCWRVAFGRAMSHKHKTLMEEVFRSIDDWSKQLSRPLNDLDDIRSVMATLKDIRENEIRIDMSLEPIEVSVLSSPAMYYVDTYIHVYLSIYTHIIYTSGVLQPTTEAPDSSISRGSGKGRHAEVHVGQPHSAGLQPPDNSTRHPTQVQVHPTHQRGAVC